ncbi:MAG TPA: hypothetical protein VGH91_07585 [Gammaproteobacteria bacterium]|jgi:hypothetical protein
MSLRQLLAVAGSAAVVALALPAFADSPAANPQSDYSSISEFPPDPFPSTYHPFPSTPTLIRHVTIYTGTGTEIDDGDVPMKDGKVAAVGKSLDDRSPARAARPLSALRQTGCAGTAAGLFRELICNTL